MNITNRKIFRRYKTYDVWDEEWQSTDNYITTKMRTAYSKNGDWIGNSNQAYRLTKKYGICEFYKINPNHCVCSIGFNPDTNTWYGWSHRAIHGFTIGSTCNKGDCHYISKDKDDFLNECINFWKDDHFHKSISARHGINQYSYYNENGEVESDATYVEGVWVDFEYNDNVPNEDLRNKISSVFNEYPKFGKGEWIAKTLDDAKQMAIDFVDGVS